MTLKSMTGFGRAEGALGTRRWHWEVRSVNGRGLDIRFRAPPGFESMEPRWREAIGKRVVRGSLNVSLNLAQEARGTEVRLNEATLAQVLRAAERVREMAGGEPPRVEALLGIKGVLETVEPEEGISEELQAALTETLERALAGLVQARGAEGARLATVLQDQLATIEAQVAIAAASPARSVDAIKKRLAEQVAKLIDASTALDPARLHQEAILAATRADIEEELKRLGAHIAGVRELLASKESVGRKLDFLSQEFNREANTLCSKSNDPEITRAGLALKSVIDQLREQVQNIE